MILSLRSMPRFIEIERDIPYSDEDEFAGLSDNVRAILYSGIFNAPIPELIGKYLAYASAADEVAFEASTSGKAIAIPKMSYLPSEAEDIREIYQGFFKILAECEGLSDDWSLILQKKRKLI